jgi:hypothetical protein
VWFSALSQILQKWKSTRPSGKPPDGKALPRPRLCRFVWHG